MARTTVADLEKKMNSLTEQMDNTTKMLEDICNMLGQSNNGKKKSAKKNAPTGKEKEQVKKDKVDINNFEPKRGKDGEYIWASYKKCRSAYCYTQLGCKVYKGKVTKPEGFTFDEKKWDKFKKEFEKKYVYVKKSDRQAS